MSYEEMNGAQREYVWVLDSSCSNHMCGDKKLFSDLNESFRQEVKLGNNTRIDLLRKGKLRLQVSGFIHIVSEVFFMLEQLQEKGLAILIKH